LSESARTGISSPLILLVDDDELVRRLTAQIIRMNGFCVIEAQDGEDALRLAGEFPIDLLITEIQMRDMDGLELARLLKSKRPSLRVLFATAAPRQDFESRLQDAFVLWKPYDSEELIEMVRKILG
jgi:CheY-like chemotaxis protein